MPNNALYKVVVVEDEPKILRNIIQKIENSDISFKVAGSAGNGEEALTLIHSIHPDVLFTDIRMPKMDGLELIRRVKNSYPEMQIVILSGYSDFNYAHQALKLGVKDYLLKPVVEDTLGETLKTIRTKLDQNLAAVQRNILFSEIHGLMDPRAPGRNAPRAVFNDTGFMVLLICIGNLCGYISSTNSYQFYNELWANIDWAHTLGPIINPKQQWWLLDEKQLNQKFLIITTAGDEKTSTPTGSPVGASTRDIISVAASLMRALPDHLAPYSLNICAAEQIVTLTDIRDTVQKLRFTLDSGLIIGKSSIITPGGLSKTEQYPPLLDKAFQNKMAALIQSNNRHLLFQELVGVFERWARSNYPQRMIEKALYQLVRQSYSQTAFLSEMEMNHLEYEIGEKLAVSADFTNMHGYIRSLFENLLLSDGKDIDNAGELVNRIADFLNSHFSEAISLEDIAKKFNFSIPYISKIFKKHQGETFLQFLITLRIKEAKRLIESSPDLEIKDICEIVGYHDQHYFSRIFKNVTGHTPSEYRESVITP